MVFEKLCTLSPEGETVVVAPSSIVDIINIENVAALEFFESATDNGTAGEKHA
jgi:hypothetical protein